MLIKAFVMACALGCASSALAQEGVSGGIHHLYNSPRALGMGGAFVAVANDYATLFYNPAGLARLDETHFSGSIDFAFSGPQFSAFLADIDAAGKIADSSASFAAMMDVLQRNYGKPFAVRTGLFHSLLARPNWSLALLLADLSMDMTVHNQGTPALNIRTYLDTTLAFGYGEAFRHMAIPGKFSWGITSKFVHRGYANKQVNSMDLMADSEVFKSGDLRDGYAIDFDWGLMFTPALPSDGLTSLFRMARPTFGLVVHNVLDAPFSSTLNLFNDKDTEPPEKLYRTVDVGSRFELPPFLIFGWRAVADVQDILHPNFTLRKGLHLGAEFDWTMAGWWRGQYRIGVNQGYPTTGASFLFGILRLDALVYGEDIGSSSTPRENRMYKIQLNVDI